ncbi:MAG: hypothetical protein M2R45_04650 [Verrucomicrobia subdivision 3 bacterium]|nr:hypothetical protein [Limisphaerales bacterium]MCS1417142.1 hypothetical protein [Limisphaerales bacterium]
MQVALVAQDEQLRIAVLELSGKVEELDIFGIVRERLGSGRA